jgi:hypothetical protein
MQYVSPFSLTETLDEEQFDKKSLSLAKKKMLAELELNGGDSIVINGRELTKNDIVIFFDSLQQTDNLVYHVLVAKDPVLRRFLEHNILENGDRFAKVEIYKDAFFIEWVGPYYFMSFTSFGNECISGLNDDAWETMFSNPVLMNSYYQEQAWDFFEKELMVDLNRLQSAGDNGQAVDENLISLLCDFHYVKMMRKLPEDRFGSLWDRYAFAIMNASVRVFNIGARNMALVYLDNARLLASSYDLKESIAKKQAEMDRIVSRGSRREGGGDRNWGFRGIAFILLIVFRIATCSLNSSTDNNYNYNVPVYVDGQRFDTSQPFDSFVKRVERMRALDSQHEPPPPQEELPDSSAKRKAIKKARVRNSTTK